MLFPIDWPEPFGLVLIESMACGTPVIGFNCGSVPEIIEEEGVTGFIVNSVNDAIDAAGRIGTLDRSQIRQRFEQRFTVECMASNYLAAYEHLLSSVPISESV